MHVVLVDFQQKAEDECFLPFLGFQRRNQKEDFVLRLLVYFVKGDAVPAMIAIAFLPLSSGRRVQHILTAKSATWSGSSLCCLTDFSEIHALICWK